MTKYHVLLRKLYSLKSSTQIIADDFIINKWTSQIQACDIDASILVVDASCFCA